MKVNQINSVIFHKKSKLTKYCKNLAAILRLTYRNSIYIEYRY